MSSDDVQLTNRLAGELGPPVAAELVGRLNTSGVQPAAVLALLDELEAMSAKIARAAVEALPDLERRAGCSQLLSWLDLGVALAESSGATALKYFKDSPLILGVIGDGGRQSVVLSVGLVLASPAGAGCGAGIPLGCFPGFEIPQGGVDMDLKHIFAEMTVAGWAVVIILLFMRVI